MLLDMKQSGDMEFPSNVSCLVVDGDVFLDTHDTSILIIHSMTFQVSLQVDPGAEDFTTHSIFI